MSNLCYLTKHLNFSQLVLSILSTHPLFTLSILAPYQSFVILSDFSHLLAPCYLFTFHVIISPYKCTCCTVRLLTHVLCKPTQFFFLSFIATMGTPAISPPIYDKIKICCLWRNYQLNFIYIFKLYTAHMRCSRENAVIRRA